MRKLISSFFVGIACLAYANAQMNTITTISDGKVDNVSVYDTRAGSPESTNPRVAIIDNPITTGNAETKVIEFKNAKAWDNQVVIVLKEAVTIDKVSHMSININADYTFTDGHFYARFFDETDTKIWEKWHAYALSPLDESYTKGTWTELWFDLTGNDVSAVGDLSKQTRKVKKIVIDPSNTWGGGEPFNVLISTIKIGVKPVEVIPAKTFAKALYTPNVVAIDGSASADEDWSNATAYDIEKDCTGKPFLVDNASGKFKMLWNESYLYVLVNVKDDDVIDVPETNTAPWNNDGMEFFINMNNTRVKGDRVGANQLRFNVGPKGFDANSFVKDSAHGTDTLAIYGKIAKVSGGYNVELQLPWTGLCNGYNAAGYGAAKEAWAAENIKKGFKFAMEYSITDATAVDARRSTINWSNDSGKDIVYQSSELYGQIELEGNIKITSINIISATNDNSITTDRGSLQLTAITNEDATNKTVTWSVENGTGAATISQTGLLTASKNGTVTVTAMANDRSGVKGSFVVAISGQHILVNSIDVAGASNVSTITTAAGTLQLTATTNADATDKTVTWSVVNGTGAATISQTGLLTASENGTVTVIATANDRGAVIGSLVVTISGQPILVNSIDVAGASNVSTITTAAGTLQLTATTNADATDKTVTWSVENGTGVATISQTGLLTASKNGTVTVIATANDKGAVKGSLVVTISGQPVSVNSIIVAVLNGSITAAGTLQLTATTNTDATDKTVTWSVENGTGAATISQTGLLTASKNGTVTVTAMANDGSGVKGSLLVTISGQGTGVQLNEASGFKMFPNPTKDNVNISMKNLRSVEIIDLTGKLVVKKLTSGSSVDINVSSINAGVYFVKVYTDKGFVGMSKLTKN